MLFALDMAACLTFLFTVILPSTMCITYDKIFVVASLPIYYEIGIAILNTIRFPQLAALRAMIRDPYTFVSKDC